MMNLKKDTILKIINLNDHLNDIFIIDNIYNKIKSDDKIDRQMISEIRLSSILSDIIENKYTDKKKHEWYTIYKYTNKKIIYFIKHDLDEDTIRELIIENSEKTSKIHLYGLNDIKIKSFDISKIEYNIEIFKSKIIKKIIIEN